MNRSLALVAKKPVAALNVAVQKNGMALMTMKFSSPQQQTRFIQTLRKRNNPGFLDTVSGMYESAEYKLDCKPFEFREGEPFFLFNYLGVVIVACTIAFAFFMCFSSLARYTLIDTQVTLSRRNPHPFLNIKTGTDMMATINPIYRFCQPFSHTIDLKQMFYNELNRARNHSL
ncbi:predicted protein [Naegleria gruberi]|uniref:Predicted protein n=1 Tax=Naegleria gruberi TaxID=5762 RepID=D2W3W5_NAEGR|nr:uncharacterized protein NAEGRDRAFT_82274 [Naegleria gruberi]EFC36243.1 predicted protein [Naegleria gruberi]|eukprot:XP_002668987.1 predicted protein [Naegleria gruberi strain NEG-M]